MGWNYRVVKTRVRKRFPNGHRVDETVYSVREVYYDKRGKPNGYTKDDIAPQGSTLKELQRAVAQMLSDIHRYPVLNYEKERRGRWT